MVYRLLLVLFSLAISPVFAADKDPVAEASSQRVAMVVGNGGYHDSNAELENPANDAKAIAAKFRSLGIEVIEAVDLDYRGMREALRKFDRALQGADAGLFYYAGHAMEYKGRNYLFPTDAILETEGDIGIGLIDMDQVLQVMETAVPTRLLFLDACRNNPLARSFRSTLGTSRAAAVGRGLGRIDTAVGTFISYATAPGDIAADGKGKNSPFTMAMLTHLGVPGLDISQLMQRVRNSVIETTSEKQIPWDSSSLRGPFILNLDVTINPAPVAASTVTGDDSQRAEIVFWESIQGSNQPADFEAYVERFGDEGVFTPLARTRITSLQRQPLEASEATIGFDRREIQKALSTLGYDTGETDGIFGHRTRTAIKAWQKDQNEPTTGYVSAKQANEILTAVASNANDAEPASGSSVIPTATLPPSPPSKATAFRETSFDDSAFYRLTTKWQGDEKSLDIVNDGSNNNKPILAKTGSYSGQRWKIVDAGKGYYRLSTMWQGDGKSLDIVNDGSNNNKPILAKTGKYSGQKWKIEDVGHGYYRLTTKWQGEGKSLDIVNDGSNNKPILAKTGNYSGQYWKIKKADFD